MKIDFSLYSKKIDKLVEESGINIKNLGGFYVNKRQNMDYFGAHEKSFLEYMFKNKDIYKNKEIFEFGPGIGQVCMTLLLNDFKVNAVENNKQRFKVFEYFCKKNKLKNCMKLGSFPSITSNKKEVLFVGNIVSTYVQNTYKRISKEILSFNEIFFTKRNLEDSCPWPDPNFGKKFKDFLLSASIEKGYKVEDLGRVYRIYKGSV